MAGGVGIGMASLAPGARIAAALGLVGALVLLGAPAQAVFLGLQPGDTIDSIGYTIDPGAGAFADAADTLDIDAQADNIDVGTGVRTEISGGAIAVNLNLASESLLFLGDGGTGGLTFIYEYTASFAGRAGVDDVALYAPTGGPAPEQDGRLLIRGEFVSDPTAEVSVFFDTAGLLGPPSLTITGTFDVQAGGDPIFESAFGSQGDLADIIGISSSSSPSLVALLADGYLFSVRDTDLGASGCGSQAAGTPCVGNVVNQTGGFTFSGNGEIVPQNPSAFVPEPSTAALLALGLAGLARGGRARHRRSGARG